MASAHPTAASPLQKLPLEILLRITDYLPTPALGHFRLTCHYIEKCLYTTFVNEFFTRKQFMITQDSLQALIDVSKSRLGRHLRFVHIGLDRFSEGVSRPLPDDEKEAKFRERYANIFTLWNTGHHQDMLAEAFRNLENLQDIIIRDFNSPRRVRDGPDAEWHSYGYKTVFEETGVSLNQGITGTWNSGFPYQYCSQVFTAIMRALGQANANPKGIEIMSKNSNHLRDFAFNIPEYLQQSVLPIIEGLEKLHLCIDLAWRSPNVGWPAGPLRAAPDLSLRKFLSHATNLRNLRINEHRSNSTALSNLLDWMLDDAGLQCQTNNASSQRPLVLSMPRLEKLSLGTMNIESARLLKLVKKFAPSLKSLELWKVVMIRSLPPNTSATPAPREIFWASFLEKLTKIPGLDLKHFKASMLQQQWSEMTAALHVSFRGYGPYREYIGPDWKHFVAEIKPLLEVQWPDDHTYSSESDDSDEDDEDEEEESMSEGDDAAQDDQ